MTLPSTLSSRTSRDNVVAVRRNPLVPLPGPGHLRDLVRLMGGAPDEVDDGDPPVTLWRIGQGASLLHEGAHAQAVYVVRSGSLKCFRTLEDGYEQVVAFVHAGDVLGFEALHCGRQPTSVVALEETTAYALPTSGGRLAHAGAAALADALNTALSRQLARAAGAGEMMSAVASDVRLARFLLWMSARMAEGGRSPRRLLLRMCRRDIASLLGVAHETVSRSFTTLAEAGLVMVQNREVEILDVERLRALARSTRATAHDGTRRGTPPVVSRGPTPAPVWFPQVPALAAAA